MSAADGGLVGRDRYLRSLAATVERRPGAPRTIALHGDPGVGKSALLEHAVRHAGQAGIRVLRLAGSEPESTLPHAGLHQLFAPVLEFLDQVEEYQRTVLRRVLGMGAGPLPDRLAVCSAAGAVIAAVAAEGPVLIAAEDVHWLDEPTREILMFLVLRLPVWDVSAVMTLRPLPADGQATGGIAATPGIAMLEVEPLDSADARELLADLHPGLPAAVRDRVLRDAAGHPLALAELPGLLRLSTRAGAGPVLLGRDRESAQVGHLLDAAAGGSGGALVLRGPAGIGKSALLAAGQRHAAERGMRVLRAVGVPAEARMPFSGLQQLLMPLRDSVAALPQRQRDALAAALEGDAGPGVNLFGAGLAVLELLADAGTGAGLLLLAEDAHWLDRATADVLGFVARRIAVEPVAVLLAVRDGMTDAFADAGLPELPVGPLDDESARAVLRRGAPQVPAELRERVLAEAAGNPLALLELPAAALAVPEAALTGASRLPVGARLERAFAARLAELPQVTQAVLLAAAAGEGCSLAEILAVAGALHGEGGALHGSAAGLGALEPAVAAGLIEPDTAGVAFRHPLVASAIYHRVPVAKRIAAHAALAIALEYDPDRSMWHRASAAIGSDGPVSAQLEEFAARAYERGAVAEAVTALERAAALSPDHYRGGVLLLRTAELSCELGRFDDARTVLARTDRTRLKPEDLMRLTLLEEISRLDTETDGERLALLVRAADAAREAGENEVAAGLLWVAAYRCWWNGTEKSSRELVARAAERADPEGMDVRMLAIRGFATPIERGAYIMERLGQIQLQPGDLPRRRFMGTAYNMVAELPQGATAWAAAAQLAREQGRLGMLPRVLVIGGWAQVWAGRWDEALAAAAEAEQLAADTGEVFWQIAAGIDRGIVAALRGRIREGELYLVSTQAHPVMRDARWAQMLAQRGRGLAALADGRYSDAYDLLARVLDPADPLFHCGQHCWVIGDLAEAARGADRIPEAREHLRRLEPLAAQTPSSGVHIAMRYARALLAADSDAGPAFEQALAAGLTDWPFDHARLLLAHGRWLRRARRPAESRTSLRQAREIFDALGARPWSDRARQELRAAGESSAERTAWAREDLTAQELQIARLAARGLSNREIGQDLFISHRTVGAHLYRVFPKLGITARSQLAHALAQAQQPEQGPALR